MSQARQILYFGFLILFLLPSLALSQEGQQDQDETKKVQHIVIGVGETQRVPLDGIAPFVVDVDILGMEEFPPGQEIKVVGLRGGTTRVYYWKNSVLTYFIVEVVLSPIFSTGSRLSPVFKSNQPYFLYSFQNSSTYTQNIFFNSPIYWHSLYGIFPSKSGNLGLFSSFNQLGGGIYNLPTAALVYQSRGFRMNLGQALAPISQLLNVFGGSNIFGSSFDFKFGTKTAHNINLFGGFKKPMNLLEPTVEEQLYGMAYSINRQRSDTLAPDFLNASFFGYQPPGGGSDFDAAFNAAGVLEANYHVLRSLSLGGGYTRTFDNKFAMTFRPALTLSSGLVQGSYSFTQHGIQNINASPLENDTHTSAVSVSHAFKDNHTVLRGAVFHNVSITNTGSLTPTSQSMGSGIELFRYASFRKLYGFNYGVALAKSAGVDTLAHSWGGTWVHPLGQIAFLRHQANYFRSDLGTSLSGANVGSSFGMETENLRYQTDLSVSVIDGGSVSKTASLGQRASIVFSGGALGLALVYYNPDLGRNEHALQVAPVLDYQLTRNQSLSLSGGLSMNFAPVRLSGSLSLQYQRFLGPAVMPDPLWKRFIGQGNRSLVNGHVFLDKNYDSVFQKTDTPLAGVKLSLDGRLHTTTDVTGYYEFKSVRAGEHSLTLDPKTFSLGEKPQVVGKQTFSVSGIQPVRLPIPITFKRAALRVQFLIDSNNNKQADIGDKVMPVNKIFVILPSGEERWHSTRNQGGALVGGIERGKNTIGFDPLEMSDGVESLGPTQKKITITSYDEYPVTFLFRPIRSLRGRVIMTAPDKSLPRGLVVQMGSYSSRVDQEGYYWFKEITQGEYQMNLRNLPKDLCVVDTALQVIVGIGVSTQMRDIRLGARCQ